MPSEHYQSCNMKAGDKEGRREERKMFLRLLLSLKGLPMALIEMRFLGRLLLLPCGEEHAIWLEQRDHTRAEAALHHLLGQR